MMLWNLAREAESALEAAGRSEPPRKEGKEGSKRVSELGAPLSVVIVADEQTYTCKEKITRELLDKIDDNAEACRARTSLDLAMTYAMEAQLSSDSAAQLVAWRAEKDKWNDEKARAERIQREKERVARSVYDDRVARWGTLDAQIGEAFAGVDVAIYHRHALSFKECDWTHVPLIGGDEGSEAQQRVFDSEAECRSKMIAVDFDDLLHTTSMPDGDSVALSWRKAIDADAGASSSPLTPQVDEVKAPPPSSSTSSQPVSVAPAAPPPQPQVVVDSVIPRPRMETSAAGGTTQPTGTAIGGGGPGATAAAAGDFSMGLSRGLVERCRCNSRRRLDESELLCLTCEGYVESRHPPEAYLEVELTRIISGPRMLIEKLTQSSPRVSPYRHSYSVISGHQTATAVIVCFDGDKVDKLRRALHDLHLRVFGVFDAEGRPMSSTVTHVEAPGVSSSGGSESVESVEAPERQPEAQQPVARENLMLPEQQQPLPAAAAASATPVWPSNVMMANPWALGGAVHPASFGVMGPPTAGWTAVPAQWMQHYHDYYASMQQFNAAAAAAVHGSIPMVPMMPPPGQVDNSAAASFMYPQPPGKGGGQMRNPGR
ncbi:hypothetical protein FOL47_009981 [Perkinsus chesapeaki]|uniref:Uncharacterized protein n=1 Tax=Perkinsus chesapeaki TaxID=330153 RepID=A0A7J6L5J1_PERCH|nr:hypothetical protein FOL47_009981 [Perkinsus chesapeaki]